MTVALITGITGQDGTYLAEFLLRKGYRVIGMVRRSHVTDIRRLAHIRNELEIVYGDLVDQDSLKKIIKETHPDEIYNLGGHSDVQSSWTQPVLTADSTALGVARLLDCIREFSPSSRFYQASTSELFGDAVESPQNEATPFNPRNPYGTAKAYAHRLVQNYREHYDLFAVSGILYNHESPRRGMEFVTRKITHTVAQIALGQADKIHLGNLDSQRDWGFAGDYVRAMWLMLQQDAPQDYVIGTGVLHSVRDFCNAAFEVVGLNCEGHIVQDPAFFRPAEEKPLVADPARAQRELGWQPEVDFKSLVKMMVDADLRALEITP